MDAESETPSMSAACAVQVAEVNFGKVEGQFFLEILKIKFSKARSAHLHTRLHYRASIAYSSLEYGRCNTSKDSTYSTDDLPVIMGNSGTYV